MKIKSKEIYRLLPQAVKDMLSYTFRDKRKEKRFFVSDGIEKLFFENNEISMMKYFDGYSNNVEFWYDNKGFHLVVNGVLWDKYFFYYGYPERELPFKTQESYIQDTLEIAIDSRFRDEI